MRPGERHLHESGAHRVYDALSKSLADVLRGGYLAVVDLDARGLTPKALERIHDALEGRPKEQTTESPRTEAKGAVAVPEPA